MLLLIDRTFPWLAERVLLIDLLYFWRTLLLLLGLESLTITAFSRDFERDLLPALESFLCFDDLFSLSRFSRSLRVKFPFADGV